MILATARANRGPRSAVWRQGLLLLAGALVLIDLYMIFEYAPTERVMGTVQRLFYFHVPVVLTSFISFAVAAVGSVLYLTRRSRAWDRLAYASATPEQYFVSFLLLCLVLFAATGIGNGSTFRTIAVVFDREQAGPVLGWTSAVAAYGAFVIPKVFGEQIRATTPEYALYGFALFYAICIVVNWWFYLRPNAYVRNP